MRLTQRAHGSDCAVWLRNVDIYEKAEERQLQVFEMADIGEIHIVDRSYVQKVLERQRRWLRHLLQMDENRIANTVLYGRVEGTPNRERR